MARISVLMGVKAVAYNDWKPIDEYEFSVRASNCLTGNFISWTWQVRRLPDRELLRVPNLGKLTLAEVRESIPYKLYDGEQDWKIPDWEERVRLAALGPGCLPFDWIDVIAGRS